MNDKILNDSKPPFGGDSGLLVLQNASRMARSAKQWKISIVGNLKTIHNIFAFPNRC